MQINIDTKHDSPEDIRKAIRMLQSLVHDKEVYTNSGSRNIFENPEPSVTPGDSEQPTNVFGNIFGDNSSSAAEASEETDTEEEKEETPQIMPYNF